MSNVLTCEREGGDDGSPVCSHIRLLMFTVVPKLSVHLERRHEI